MGAEESAMAHTTEGRVDGIPATMFFNKVDNNDENKLSWTEGYKICAYDMTL